MGPGAACAWRLHNTLMQKYKSLLFSVYFPLAPCSLPFFLFLHFYLHFLPPSLKATVGFFVLNDLAGLLRGSTPWNWTFDAATGLQRRNAEGKTMCHARARCVTSSSKNAPKGYFRLLPGHTFALGQCQAKPENVQPSFLCQVSLCALRERFRKRDTAQARTFLIGYSVFLSCGPHTHTPYSGCIGETFTTVEHID